MHAKVVKPALLLVLWIASGYFRPSSAQESALPDHSPSGLQALPDMKWRLIGPFRGGRVLAVAGVPGRPEKFYFGAVAGGVWKTDNAGRTWRPIFDAEPIASIGAIAVSPSAPDTIYVGTGEADMRSDISYGDGVYKSTDGGAIWRNIGLRDSRHIGRILVDPRNPDVLLVAALGHAYGPNSERGVYRSTDGGSSWTRVLGKDDNTGAIDLASDPADSRIIYASLWQARRPPWSVYAPISGPGSGLYKSSDSGITWRQIVGNGFPSDGVGRIGIAVAPSAHGSRIFALVDATEGGLYRSDDAGTSWRKVSSDRRIWQRGWYFGNVTADPRDPDTVYVSNTALYRSIDGGETLQPFKGAPGGDDYHQLWISPADPRRMVLGVDQGAIVTVDGGLTWSSWYNQPTAQFYHVITDDAFPYRVYGSQQDSGTAAVQSRGDYGQITWREWSPIGGDESGYIVPDLAASAVYGGGPFGGLNRFDWTTGQSLVISPDPVLDPAGKFRFSWTSPLVASPQDPRVLFFGAQFVLRSDDRGMSWHVISPDLTADSSHPGSSGLAPSGGDNKQTPRGVVYTIAPSPLAPHQIWAGSDTGLIHLTKDGGASWANVTPRGLPEWSQVSLIEASHSEAGTAYAAVDRHQMDDYHPYIYRTRDFGRTWSSIVEGLPSNSYVHVVREDPFRPGLLFAGTETGVFFSLNDGGQWQSLRLNLPLAPIHDIAIHGDDVIVATHGRSFWILDDIEPIRESSAQIHANAPYLFHPATAVRIRRSENRDTPLPAETPVGANPPAGATIDYSLAAGPGNIPVAMEIRNADGNLVRKFSSDDRTLLSSAVKQTPPEFSASWIHQEQILSNAPGMHRFTWDLRYPPPSVIRYDYSAAAPLSAGTVPLPQGPLVPPGKYEIRLIVGGDHPAIRSAVLNVQMDPRVKLSPDDLAKQLDLEIKIDAALSDATAQYFSATGMASQLAGLQDKLSRNSRDQDLANLAKSLREQTEKIAGHETEWPDISVGFRNIGEKLSALAQAVDSADSVPTQPAYEAWSSCERQMETITSEWIELKNRRLPLLNDRLRAAGYSAIVVGDGSKMPAAQ